MAVLLNGSSEFFGSTSLPTTAVPLTMAGWFYSTDATVEGAILSITKSNDNNHAFILYADGATGGDPVQAVARGGAFDPVPTTTGFTANTWHHACAVFASNSSRSVYIDGGSKGTETSTHTPSGVDRFSAGVWDRPTGIWHFPGRLAELGVWTVALTDNEVKMLAAGVSPLRVCPENLVRYYPCYNASVLENYSLGLVRDLTVTGSPSIADHAPVIPQWGFDTVPGYSFVGGGPSTYEESVTYAVTLSATDAVVGTFEPSVTNTITTTVSYVGGLAFEATITDAVTVTATDTVDAIFEGIFTDAITAATTLAIQGTYATSISDSITTTVVISTGTSEEDIIAAITVGVTTALQTTFEAGISEILNVTATTTMSGRITVTWTPVDDSAAQSWSGVDDSAAQGWTPVDDSASQAWTDTYESS